MVVKPYVLLINAITTLYLIFDPGGRTSVWVIEHLIWLAMPAIYLFTAAQYTLPHLSRMLFPWRHPPKRRRYTRVAYVVRVRRYERRYSCVHISSNKQREKKPKPDVYEETWNAYEKKWKYYYYCTPNYTKRLVPPKDTASYKHRRKYYEWLYLHWNSPPRKPPDPPVDPGKPPDHLKEWMKGLCPPKPSTWVPYSMFDVGHMLSVIDPLMYTMKLLEVQQLCMPPEVWKWKQSILVAAANLMGKHCTNPSIYTASKKNDRPIVIDSGASYSVSPFLMGFVTLIEDAPHDALNGLDSAIKVQGRGMVEWEIQDVDGNVRTIRTMAYFVPTAQIRLYSPQVHFDEHKSGCFKLYYDRVILTLPDGENLYFPIQVGNNLPVMLTKSSLSKKKQKKSRPRVHFTFWEENWVLAEYPMLGKAA